jgi:predicted GNAT family N-acyltransferase
MTTEIRRVRDADELAAAYALRVEVFTGEQGVRAEVDGHDRDDDEAVHLVAVTDDGSVVGTCRVLPQGAVARIGRLVVARAARRQGIASGLLREAAREAVSAGAERLRLHAQTAARPLYEQAGYHVVSEPFDEEGIEHVTMDRDLHA